MIKDYNKILQDIIIEKSNALEKLNYFKFYKESPELLTSFDIAIFILAEDTIIDISKTNRDIKSRYTTSIDKSVIDSLFDGMHFSQYFKDIRNYEQEGDNIWFISALRNAFVHGGIKGIDLEKGTLLLKSDHELNKLEGEIPLSFFEKFTELYTQYQKPSGFSFSLDNSDYKSNNNTEFETYDYIFGVQNIEDLSNEDMDDIIIEATIIFDHLMQGLDIHKKDFKDSNPNKETEELLNRVASHKILDKNSKEYKETFRREFEILLLEKLLDKYPNLEITIKDKQKGITDTELKEHLSMMPYKYVLWDLGEDERFDSKLKDQAFINEIIYLKQKFLENSNYVAEVENKLSPKGVECLYRLPETILINPKDILQQAIHISRTEQGLHHNYDTMILYDLISFPNGKHSELLTSETETITSIKELILNPEYENYKESQLIELIKERFPEFIAKCSETFSNNNIYSSEDNLEFATICKWHKLSNFINNYNNLKDRMLTGLLYTYGINVYVPNKAINDQSSSLPRSYWAIPFLDINVFSTDSKNKQKALNEQLNKQTKLLATKQLTYDGIKDNPHFPLERKESFKHTLDEINADIQFIKESIMDEINVNYEGRVLADESDSEKIATFLRNCLAHEGRISVLPNTKDYESTILKLEDISEVGALTIGYCTLESLITFISIDNIIRPDGPMIIPDGPMIRPDDKYFFRMVGKKRIAEGVANAILKPTMPNKPKTQEEPQ